MPRRSAGPKLWFDKERQTWTIIDGRKRSRTGCGPDEAQRAQESLRDYIATKHSPKGSPDPLISDVLNVYSSEVLAGKLSEAHVLYDIAKLAKWWGKKCVSSIGSQTCKDYAAHRNAPPSARRELSFLNAAVRHWHAEHGPLKALPVVVRPEAPQPRAHFMTREQAARFLWNARRTPHLARFFIIGWYTGSRRTVICQLRWSMIDLRSGIMHRKAPGERQAKNKLAPPLRMGRRLMAHLKRWKRLDGKGAEWVIHYKGKPIKRPVRTWEQTRKAAKLPAYVVPHVLRHTRATNMMKQGKDPWESAKALGMSLTMLEKVYGHHHPDWQKDVADTR